MTAADGWYRPKPPPREQLLSPHAPPCPDLELPPQHVVDSCLEDGPVSVAMNLKPHVFHIGGERPGPHTLQYGSNRYGHQAGVLRPPPTKPPSQPRLSSDVCGWVLASASEGETELENFLDMMQLCHNELRLVFQCISGWCLMQWRSEEEFEVGIQGGPKAPRAVSWIDLRTAYDVRVEEGNAQAEVAPYRIAILMAQGNFYFRLELAEDLPVWHDAIRRVIQDANWQSINARDTAIQQRKRWPAAIGVADALFVQQAGLGERAMAILFHVYDIDGACSLCVGELMVLLREIHAGLLHCEGTAEGRERDTAVLAAAMRVGEDDLFERAIVMRRRCCPQGGAKVLKDDFIRLGPAALAEALGLDDGSAFENPGLQWATGWLDWLAMG
eukprot:CAMPEP_0206475454 /NCGR_PEP_ID=MMETSP0324_2-20121206/34090_1 /ASSEMBLY_ACC=CAM_ASM_000836 /TAXON_ID=2866 /ORGANISM="Crypthecodinium cohnii, Strain Seligo" /LENGTH=385 /DNA_ID=CAMNT_0053950817 /DNA_START=150 /DNA_END=1310 /DNA_ORIENTATION=+